MSLCQHNDGTVLREKIAVQDEISKNDESKWDIKLWSRNDIIGSNKELNHLKKKEI